MTRICVGGFACDAIYQIAREESLKTFDAFNETRVPAEASSQHQLLVPRFEVKKLKTNSI